MRTVTFAEATDPEIINFAQILGLDIEPGSDRNIVIASIQTVFPGDAFNVPDAPAPVDMAGSAPPRPEGYTPAAGGGVLRAEDHPANAGATYADPRAVIIIDNAERDGVISKVDVAVGVNGVVWQLKRGVKLDVPFRVVEALNNAVRNSITHNDEGEVVESETLAYNYRPLEMPSRDQIAEWHERVDAAQMA